jgi:hypothetical protein
MPRIIEERQNKRLMKKRYINNDLMKQKEGDKELIEKKGKDNIHII